MSAYEQSVFISYAWGAEREDIVNEIDETLQQRGVRIVRDKRALGYRGSIRDFMERIGRGSCIIVVISDKYLRSPNCMFELVEIADNKQFHDRIFPIVLSDANIYDPLRRIEYIKFWEGKRKELAKAMKTLDPANLQGIREEMDQYDRIRDKISGITSILKDMNTLTPDMHRDSEFSNLYDAILERLRETSTDVTTEFSELVRRAETERTAKDEAERVAAQKAEQERITKAEADRQAKEEADRLAAQKTEKERIERERVEQERLALAKIDADRKAKAERERIERERVEQERLALAKVEAERKAKEKADRLAAQKAKEERIAKAEADRKAKQETDRLAAQRAEERKAKEKVVPAPVVPAEVKAEPASFAPAERKPTSRVILYGMMAVAILAVAGIGVSTLLRGRNQEAPFSTQTTHAVPVTGATDAPIKTFSTPTTAEVIPTDTATIAPTPVPALGVGSTMISEKDGMILLYVPAGEFTMGNDLSTYQSDRPEHSVFLDAFWIDQTEVTNAMYSQCVEEGKCNAPAQTNSELRSEYYGNPEFDNFPVIFVQWEDAKAYCAWAGRRLPTEAEWEKAARGEDGRLYPWGNDQPSGDLLNYDDTVGDTTEVGKYPKGASPYGAWDMAGNVYEWVSDWYDVYYYGKSPASNPTGPESGDFRAARGGAWSSDDSVASTFRNRDGYVSYTDGNVGFRCARDG